MDTNDIIMRRQGDSAEVPAKGEGYGEKVDHIESAPVQQVDDIPAIVDVHGDVIKADWHAIREKANAAEVYEHSISLWTAMKTYKKVRGCCITKRQNPWSALY